MKGLLVCLLLATAACCVHGVYLDDICSTTVYVTDYQKTYRISDSVTYIAHCTVRFIGISDLITLTIRGDRVDPSSCDVHVNRYDDLWSLTDGSLQYSFPFTKTVTSVSRPNLVLHVSGSGCGSNNLRFTPGLATSSRRTTPTPSSRLCPEHTCNDGGCILSTHVCDGFDDCNDGSDEWNCSSWSTGHYVGVGIGSSLFFLLVVLFACLRYRRVMLIRRSAVVITGPTTVQPNRL